MRAILTYHSIDASGSPISTDAQAFSRHVEWLASGPVRIVPLDTLLDLPPQADAVALTFDDGFVNFGTTAAPLLAARSLPATLFVVSGHVGGTNAWGGRSQPGIPTLPLLDWDALGGLADAGFGLGAHTRTHRRLPEVSSSEVADELEGCRDDIRKNTGHDPTSFAYPYGAVTPAAAALVSRVFRYGCTTEHRALAAHEEHAQLPRVDMYYFRNRPGLEGWGTAAFRGRLWARRTARSLRGALHQVRLGR